MTADLDRIGAAFAASAAEVDAGERDVRDGLRRLAAEGVLCPADPAGCEVVTTFARSHVQVSMHVGTDDDRTVWSERACPHAGSRSTLAR